MMKGIAMVTDGTFRHMVVIEAQKVKDYLFASPAMREIRGASLLLDRVNRVLVPGELSGYKTGSYAVLYLAGGGGRVLFRNRQNAEDFARRVEELYRKETVNARVTVEVVKRGGGASGVEPFPAWHARGLEMTRRQKTGRSISANRVAGRWIKPCTSCGMLPAERLLVEHGKHYLCRACLAKRQEVRGLYADIKPGKATYRLLADADTLSRRYSDAFVYTTLSRSHDPSMGTPHHLLVQDFDDIGQHARPSNYMAFVYADGNRMGEVLRSFTHRYSTDAGIMAALEVFSAIVDRSTRQAAVEAVLETLPPVCHEVGDIRARLTPAEFVMAGGDDLMLVLPADRALDATVAFLDKFQEKTLKLQKEAHDAGRLSALFAEEGLTASAGVVVAHAHYPVRHLMDLAAQLMKKAKYMAFRRGASPSAGTLDFMVVSDSGSDVVSRRREREYGGHASCRLTERPYTTEGVRRLLGLIRSLKSAGAPRTKLKKLYAALFQSPLQAQYDGLQIRERLKTHATPDQYRAFSDFFAELDRFPFRSNGGGLSSWSTPISEIVEFYDYVHLSSEDAAK